MKIMGEKYKLMGWYKEGNYTNFIIMKEGNVKPHLLMSNPIKENLKLFGPLGNSLPAEELELNQIVKTLEEEGINA